MYYYAASRTPLADLVNDCLVQAHNVRDKTNFVFHFHNYSFFFKSDFDVFNALDIMDNKEFLEKLKFGDGDGNIQYYIYNWKCPLIPPEKVCFTLSIFIY
jgi:glycylpeptide N-tetradecanoyltransferase